MANTDLEVDLSGIDDPQRPLALAFGVVLVLLGAVSLSGVLSTDGVLLGVFGIPVWLALVAVVAGVLGVVLSTYAGAGTTFNKVAAGLVLPAVLFLAVVDWTLAVGGLALVVGLVALLLAVVVAAVGTVLLWGHPLAFVFPAVALLAVLDWVLSATGAVSTGAAVTPATLLLLAVLAAVVGAVGFEGGRRLTGRPGPGAAE